MSPLPLPDLWTHADIYPDFSVWDWKVESDRKRRGFTSLVNVSPTGFHSSVISEDQRRTGTKVLAKPYEVFHSERKRD
jgi:hypothetical protein